MGPIDIPQIQSIRKGGNQVHADAVVLECHLFGAPCRRVGDVETVISNFIEGIVLDIPRLATRGGVHVTTVAIPVDRIALEFRISAWIIEVVVSVNIGGSAQFIKGVVEDLGILVVVGIHTIVPGSQGVVLDSEGIQIIGRVTIDVESIGNIRNVVTLDHPSPCRISRCRVVIEGCQIGARGLSRSSSNEGIVQNFQVG